MNIILRSGGNSMPRKGRDFELLYQWLYNLDSTKYKVTSPARLYDKITETTREVDVLVEYLDDKGLNRKIGIECRDREKIEDSIWIEQLTTKKEDLELDCIIATTTRNFSKGAIKKAKAHGVIVECAETFDEKSLDDSLKDFYLDIYFLKFEFIQLFFKRNDKLYTFNELLKVLNFAEQNELISELKGPLYCSLNPHEVLRRLGFELEDFYKSNKNNLLFRNVINGNNLSELFKKLNITFIYYEILAIPLKVTYPVNKQISVFTVSQKKNKKFRARYGTDEEYFEWGYVDDGKIQSTLKLKERKYYRYIGMTMQVNTIFPEGYKALMSEDSLTKEMAGEISFEKIVYKGSRKLI